VLSLIYPFDIFKFSYLVNNIQCIVESYVQSFNSCKTNQQWYMYICIDVKIIRGIYDYFLLS